MTFCKFNIYTHLKDNVVDDELSFSSNQSILETVYPFIYPTSTGQQSIVSNDEKLQNHLRKVL